MENKKQTPEIMPTVDTQNFKQAPVPHSSNTSRNQSEEHQTDAQANNQVNEPHTTSKADAEILSVHLNDTQTSTNDAKIGGTNATALFDSGATLSCMSK